MPKPSCAAVFLWGMRRSATRTLPDIHALTAHLTIVKGFSPEAHPHPRLFSRVLLFAAGFIVGPSPVVNLYLRQLRLTSCGWAG